MISNSVHVKIFTLLICVASVILYVERQYLFSIFAGLFSLLIINLYNLKLNGLLSLITIFTLGSSLYVTAEPISLIFFDYSEHSISDIALLFVMGCIFMACVFLGYHDKSDYTTIVSNYQRGVVGIFPFHLVLIIVIMVYIYLVYVDVGFAIGSLSRSESFQSRSVYLSIIRTSFIALFILYCVHLSREHGRRFFVYTIFIAFIFVELFVLGDRRLAISCIIVVMLLHKEKFSGKKGVIVIASLFVVFSLFGLVRNQAIGSALTNVNKENVSQKINPMSQDFGYFHRVGIEILNARYDKVFMQTYVLSLSNLIPQYIYPNRYDGPSLWYVKTFHNDIYLMGGGLAFNSVIESYMNFKYAGPVLVGLAVGFVLSIIASQSSNTPIYYFTSTIAPFFMRMDSAGIVKSFAIFVCFYLFFYILSKRRAGFDR